MDEAGAIVSIIRKSFINDKEHLCEIIDVGSATKSCLDNTHLSLEKKIKFKEDCRAIVLMLLAKLAERAPIKYNLVRNATSLSPINIVKNEEDCVVRFRSLSEKTSCSN